MPDPSSRRKPSQQGAPRLRSATLEDVSKDAFPFSSYRSGQREILEAARAAFEGGKRFVVVEAPTGTGKSAIGVTMAREAATAFVVTAQKVLQEQYLRDFPDIALMKGRSNYPCLVVDTHAAAAPCLAGRRFPACDDCPYFVAKDAAMAANISTLNYAYYLAELNYAGGFQPRELLVLDEAHNCESSLMGFVQVAISEAQLNRAGLTRPLPPRLGDDVAFDFAADLLPDLVNRSKALDAELKVPTSQEADLQRMRLKQWVDGMLQKVRVLLDSAGSGEIDWVVERGRGNEGESLTFKPIEVGTFAEDLLFSHADRVLMLSATILDPDTYLRSLGIDPDEAEFVRSDSAFAAHRRPVVVRPSARLTRHYLDADLPRLAEAVSEVAADHARDKGIVHAHSYKIATYLAANLAEDQRWRIVTHHGSADRDAALSAHLASPEPTILISPSMTEGIDLIGDLSRWQVICKVPYPNLGDSQVKARMERDRAWYDWRTCLAVVQAYGRSVRSADDHAVTYLLDADFPGFLKRQRARLPEWFLEAIE